MRKSCHWALVSMAVLPLIPAAQAQPAGQMPAYHVVQTVPLGAPDRWDYLVYDRPSHRLYVSHGDTLSVLDGQSGAMIGTVAGVTGGTHGIGISAATGKGYTVDGAAGQAVAFDLKTLKTGAHLKADADADGIAFDPNSGHIFVVDGDPGKLTVVDPKTDSVITNIELGGKLEYAVSGENGKVYVNGEANKEIVRVDTASNAVDAHWPNPGCTSPHGLAIDTASHRLFISCANAVMTVMNADNGAVLATLPIGQGSDGAAFDPKRKLAFASNNDGSVSVIREVDARTFVSAGSIKTPVTGKNMTINPDTGRLYVAVADIDPNAAVAPGPGGRPGRPRPLPGSLKILFIDP